MPKVLIKIYRCNKSVNSDSYFDEYQIECAPNSTLLEVLDKIRASNDPTLAYDSSCRIGLCASCSMAVNSKVELACQVNMQEWVKANGDVMTVTPKNIKTAVKDLVTDAALSKQLSNG